MIPYYQLSKQPIFRVLCGAFLISFSAVFVRVADVSPSTSGFYRVFLGSIFLFFYLFWKREQFKLSACDWPLTTFCGFIFALDLYFWHESIIYIGPGLATIIGNFQVFILAAIGILFLGEKVRGRFLASIPLAIVGLFCIVGEQWHLLEHNYKIGIYFGLATAVCYAAFLLSLRKLQTDNRQSQPFTLMLVSLFSAIFLAIKILYTGDSFKVPDITSGAALVGLGLSSQSIGWLLIAQAMPKIRASLTGLILLLQPALSFFWDVSFFNRPTDILNWIGFLVTLIAIYMGVTGKLKEK